MFLLTSLIERMVITTPMQVRTSIFGRISERGSDLQKIS